MIQYNFLILNTCKQFHIENLPCYYDVLCLESCFGLWWIQNFKMPPANLEQTNFCHHPLLCCCCVQCFPVWGRVKKVLILLYDQRFEGKKKTPVWRPAAEKLPNVVCGPKEDKGVPSNTFLNNNCTFIISLEKIELLLNYWWWIHRQNWRVHIVSSIGSPPPRPLSLSLPRCLPPNQPHSRCGGAGLFCGEGGTNKTS